MGHFKVVQTQAASQVAQGFPIQNTVFVPPEYEWGSVASISSGPDKWHLINPGAEVKLSLLRMVLLLDLLKQQEWLPWCRGVAQSREGHRSLLGIHFRKAVSICPTSTTQHCPLTWGWTTPVSEPVPHTGCPERCPLENEGFPKGTGRWGGVYSLF